MPKRAIAGGTLRVTFPLGRTILTSVIMLILTIGALEAAGRTGFILPYLLRPLISGHPYLGAELEKLAQIERQEGPVDCFVLGSSIAFRGLNAMLVAQEIETRTGRPIRCLVLGTSGMNFRGAARLAAIVAEKYHPRLIIYAMNYRDTGAGFTMDIPWADQQLGQPSLEGWLDTNSMAYRYYLGLSEAAQPIRPLLTPGYTPEYGYLPLEDVMDVSQIPDPGSEPYTVWHDFVIAKRDKFLTWLDAILDLKSPNTAIMLVEMPMPPSLLKISPESVPAHQRFIAQIDGQTSQKDVPFIAAPPPGVIPTDGWADFLHMNRKGGDAFSTWLSERIGQVVLDGQLLTSD